MGVVGKKEMIKTYKGLKGIIAKETIKKHGSIPTSLLWDRDYQLEWLGNHRVKVTAWAMKWGAQDFSVEFVVLMGKDLMRLEENRLYEWIHSKSDAKRIDKFLYSSKEVYREFERKRREKLHDSVYGI